MILSALKVLGLRKVLIDRDCVDGVKFKYWYMVAPWDKDKRF